CSCVRLRLEWTTAGGKICGFWRRGAIRSLNATATEGDSGCWLRVRFSSQVAATSNHQPAHPASRIPFCCGCPQLTPNRIRPHIPKLTGGGNESQRIPGDWGRGGGRGARGGDETNARVDGDRRSRRHTPSNGRPPLSRSV